MATFCAEKLTRKMNGRFQSTALKSKARNVLDSLKTKSRVIALMMLKCHFSPIVKVKLSGRCVAKGLILVCFLFSPKQGW